MCMIYSFEIPKSVCAQETIDLFEKRDAAWTWSSYNVSTRIVITRSSSYRTINGHASNVCSRSER